MKLSQLSRLYDDEIIEQQFLDTQTDLMHNEVTVHWCGSFVRLLNGDVCLTTITADNRMIQKLMRYCIKNGYRCSQIKPDRTGKLRIML